MSPIYKIILLLIMNMRIHVIALLISNINCFAIDDFNNVLNLTKYSVCKDEAVDLVSGRFKIQNHKS